MLGNLDNGVIFKKAFTNKIVFTAFVRDVLGFVVEVDKIETEKKFEPKIGYVDFELDIFAETVDQRIVIEIQKIQYDHNFDRFLHYFLMTIAEQQKRSKNYGINQTVYMIVVLTAPYTICEKNGKPVKDEFLLMKFNPQSVRGEERDLYGHQFTVLNPNHPATDTPQPIRDWLDLIYQSIHNPERPALNTQNDGIKKAVELIDFNNLTPEERAQAKNAEAAIETKAIYENIAKAEGKIEGKIEGEIEGKIKGKIETAENLIGFGVSDEIIAKSTNLSLKEIEDLRNQN